MLEQRPLLGFILRVLAWLPFIFYAWFGLSHALAWLVTLMADPLFSWLLPHTVKSLSPLDADVLVLTRFFYPDTGKAIGILAHPLEQGYGLPLFVALSLAAQLDGRRLLGQLAIGFLLVFAVQLWGLFFGILYRLRIELNASLQDVPVHLPWIDPLIDYSYSLSVLILPGIVPVAAWSLLNWRYLEGLGRRPVPSGE